MPTRRFSLVEIFGLLLEEKLHVVVRSVMIDDGPYCSQSVGKTGRCPRYKGMYLVKNKSKKRVSTMPCTVPIQSGHGWEEGG